MRICINEPSIASLRFTRFYLMEGEENIDSFSDYGPFQQCKGSTGDKLSLTAPQAAN
jgi:hypothetical protein